ncbi:MAG: apolipoprotein N-acyltransferase [Chroococcidiopsidaceae cyanobacterium CP_BM_ER_R8_30]|nr:apolipoprotein N-acyltransferase [Chroococcidiopsidaceae cyanobacterium CP_BM_ER_R8_30]
MGKRSRITNRLSDLALAKPLDAKSAKRLEKRGGGGRKVILHLSLLLIALASGCLMGSTVAPVGAWPLAWVALAPLWVIVASPALFASPAFPALFWGIGYHGLALWWITGIHPMTWMGVPWLASLVIALFCWFAATLWGAALVVVWAVGMTLISRVAKLASWSRVAIGVALWCGLEAVWTASPLCWTSLAYTQSPHNLAILHLGQLSGFSAVAASVVVVNALLAEAWINRQAHRENSSPPHPLALLASNAYALRACFANGNAKALRRFISPAYLGTAVGFLVCLHLLGLSLYNRPLPQPPTSAIQVGIIQGNVPNEIKLYPAGFRRAIEGYTTGYLSLADQGVDAVLTPEGALPFLWNQVVHSSLYSAIQEKGVVAWVGAFGKQGNRITNSLFTVTGTGVFSRYNKEKLVPLGEYIPFEQFLGGIVNRLSPLDAHQVAGQPHQVFDTPFGRAIVSICFESAFSEHFRYQAAAGGEFILSASNDAHYSPTMPAQHQAQDVMRAIETDRWAVRATNTGYSAIIDPHGRVPWISRLKTYELHAATIYRRQTQTLYVRWGDWLTPLLLVLGVSAFLLNATGFGRQGVGQQ